MLWLLSIFINSKGKLNLNIKSQFNPSYYRVDRFGLDLNSEEYPYPFDDEIEKPNKLD